MCSSVDDVRVAPLLGTQWTQPMIEGRYGGCVATAGAQIMRYFEYPKGEVSSFTNAFCAIEGEPATLAATGGVYDWAKMPERMGTSSSEDGNAEVVKLIRDLGVACGMNYRSVGSEVGGYMLTRAWTVHFGYRSAASYTLEGDLPLEAVHRALVSNLDAGLPVEVGLTGAKGGHAVVVDGYGYRNGELHYHLNFGWGGTYDGWYVLPRIEAGPDTYTAIGSIVYNIFPERGAGYTICSGRVLDANGRPVAGACVSAVERYWGEAQATAVTNEKGIYALYLPSTWTGYAPYTLRAEYEGHTVDLSVRVKMCISPIVTEDGRFNADGSMVPAVNNLTDRNFVLPFALEPDPPAPEPPADSEPPAGALPGDFFAWPVQLSGTSGTHEIENTSAFTLETDEPKHTPYPESHSAWYLWTAPGSGTVTFTVSSRWKVGSTTFIGHPMIAAYQGESLSAARRIAVFERFEADDSTSVTFAVKQDERYRIVVIAYDGASDGGPYSLSWAGTLETMRVEPEIDLIATIRIVDGEPVVSWTPDLGEGYLCTILGSRDLKTWSPVEDGRAKDYTYFKVLAEMR